MPGRVQNPNNYPLTRLSSLAIAYRTDEMRLRAQMEEELQKELLRMRVEFETELIRARDAGVGVSELARQTNYSRPYMYEVLKAANKAAWFRPDESVVLPHSDIFQRTGALRHELTVTFPKTMKELGIKAGQRATGWAGYRSDQGWQFSAAFDTPNREMVGTTLRPGGHFYERELRGFYEEWAEAAWPEVGTRPTYEEMQAARNGVPLTAPVAGAHTEHGTAEELFAGVDDE